MFTYVTAVLSKDHISKEVHEFLLRPVPKIVFIPNDLIQIFIHYANALTRFIEFNTEDNYISKYTTEKEDMFQLHRFQFLSKIAPMDIFKTTHLLWTDPQPDSIEITNTTYEPSDQITFITESVFHGHRSLFPIIAKEFENQIKFEYIVKQTKPHFRELLNHVDQTIVNLNELK